MTKSFIIYVNQGKVVTLDDICYSLIWKTLFLIPCKKYTMLEKKLVSSKRSCGQNLNFIYIKEAVWRSSIRIPYFLILALKFFLYNILSFGLAIVLQFTMISLRVYRYPMWFTFLHLNNGPRFNLRTNSYFSFTQHKPSIMIMNAQRECQ